MPTDPLHSAMGSVAWFTAHEKGERIVPMKLNLGLSRKAGEPNYGSRGASMNIELELDSTLLAEPAKLQERVRQVFGLVRAALAEEMNGNGGHGGPPEANQPIPEPNSSANGNSNVSAPPPANNVRMATLLQVKAIFAIARNQKIDVPTFLHSRFGTFRADKLNVKEASLAIDELKRQQAAASA